VFEVAPIDGASEIRDIVALPDGSAVAAIGFHDAHIVALDGSLTEVWRHSIPEYQPGIRLAVAPDDAIYVLVQGLPNNEYSRRVVNEGRIDVLAPDGRLERVIEGLEPDLRATGIGVMDGGTILLVGTVTRDTADYEIGVVAVDGESGETLWFDTAGRHGDEPFLSEDSGVDLAVAASGDAFTLGTYDDRGATGLRGWLRMYTAGGIEPQ
jgi:hypothetical protein